MKKDEIKNIKEFYSKTKDEKLKKHLAEKLEKLENKENILK